MNFENIPSELKINGLWCLWKKVEGKGKIPFDAVTENFAKSNDKSTFHSFSVAFSKIHNYYHFNENNEMIGGLGLGIFNGYSAIDIDNCLDPITGNLSEEAEDIIEFCSSYTEVSPSGKGIRIILKTQSVIDKNKYYINNSKNGIEIYISENTNKFVTITGNVIFPNDIKEVNLSYVLDKYMQKRNTSVKVYKDLDFRLQRALTKDKKLISLWNGTAPGSGSNESELDLALCSKIAFYLNGEEEKVNDSFILSPYFNSKDDLHKNKWLNRNDYKEMTLQKSCENFISKNEFVIDSDDFNDTGNAYKLIEKFGNIVKYNVDNSKWMIWNGKYWQTDVYNNIKNFAELIAEDLKQQALLLDSPDQIKKIHKNVNRILSSAGKTAMLKEAEHIDGIPITNEEFDNEHHIINCKDGFLNLKTGEIEKHNRNKNISKYTPFSLSEKPAKKWLSFLDDVFAGDQELIDYMQKVAGYSLTGFTKEQSMFILVGDGANGKSILLEILNMICGSYGSTSNVEILLDKKNSGANLGDVARLNKIRNVVTDETKIGDKLNESAIKTMTSGIGKIVARFLYGNEFEFTPIFKIFMATNYKPVIRGTDHGIWRRLKIIPFNVTFAPEAQDKELIEKLKLEMDEIFTWAVEGAKEWFKNGLQEPQVLIETIKEYRTEMDIIQQWVDEACDVGNFREPSKELFENFSNFVTINKEYQMSQTLFGRNMSKKFKKRRIGGIVYYEGLRLKKDSIYWLDEHTYKEI